MPEIIDICGFNHCRQHIPSTSPGGIHRHYVRKHNGRYPPEGGVVSDDDDDDMDHPDAKFHNDLFWAAQAQRRREEAEDRVEDGDPARKFTVKEHPDAGWACNEKGEWLEERCPPPIAEGAEVLSESGEPYAPFDDARQWSWADRVTATRMSRSQLNTHMRWHKEQEPTEPAFTNYDQYRKKVDEIEGSEWTSWKQVKVKVELEDLPEDANILYPFLNEEHTFYFRNTDDVLKQLISNPSFVGRQSYSPTEYSLPDGPFVTEPHTGERAQEFQVMRPQRLFARCMLATRGKSAITVWGKPLLSLRLKLKVASDAIQLDCSILLEALRPILTTDQLRLCADGHYRWIRAYLGCNPVDYPEGGWLLNVIQNWVVCCEQAPNKLGDGPGRPRTSQQSAAYRAKGAEYAWTKGLHMEVPYFDKFGIDGHQLIISDLLHQLVKGAFKDITIDKLVKEYIKSACGQKEGVTYDLVMNEIARRLEVLPPSSGLRRFKDGIEFSQWTGKDSRALMTIISAALWNVSWGEEGTEDHRTIVDEVTQAVSAIVVVFMYASSLESTATDREMQAAAIELYHVLIRDAFADERKKNGFNWMRLHSLFHYVDWTVQHGTAPHSDSARYETAHIAAVKEPYRASNRCHAIVQILRSNTRKDSMAWFKTKLEMADIVPAAKPMPSPLYQLPRTVLPARGDREKRLVITDLAESRGVPELVPALNVYLADLFDTPGFVYTGQAEGHSVASASFPVYEKPAYASNDTCRLMKQRIYATANYSYRGEAGNAKGPRHDVVLVKGKRHDELHGRGFASFDVCRARLFFVVRHHGHRLNLCLGEVYDKDPSHIASRSTMMPVIHPADVDGEPTYRVFAVADILRSIHIQPLFGFNGVPRDLCFTDTLDRWRGHYAVGLFADQHVFRLLFRPDALKFIQRVEPS
ncbi:hypothetical protein P7C70_g3877, partial [Phenoliferia sp. Uapishka_3]